MTPGVVASSYQTRVGPAPYFSQKQPLPNWEVNCVPTSVAMILTKLAPHVAQKFGHNPLLRMFDSNQLVHNLSSWMVAQQGGKPGLTDFNVLAEMLNQLGLPAEGFDGVPMPLLKKGLGLGRQAIVMGDALALPSTPLEGRTKARQDDLLHAIVVTAYDAKTQTFLVNDPQDPANAPRVMSEAQLNAFANSVENNIHGAANGVMVVVG